MNKKKKITVNGKVKKLPQHLLKKKNNFQKKKKGKGKHNNKKTKHQKQSNTVAFDPQLIAKQNLLNDNGQQHEHGDDYVSSDTSAEWFDGDEDSDSKAYGQGGYLRVRIGDKLNNRYIIESKLGWGHFSTVWLATDLLAPSKSIRRFVALKIQKSAPHYLDAAKDEVQLLSAAKNKSGYKDDYNENYIVQMVDSFIVSASNGKHVVFVFEVLGENLLDLIKSYNYRGLPIAIVKKIAREVLLGLDYLHSECDIIHTDLKPENVLISRTKPINVKQLEIEKNRELKKQYERQLKRFEQQMDYNQSGRKQLSKNQKKKLRQKINELKKNISNIDKKYIILCKENNINIDDNKQNDSKKPLKPQFEFIHGRCISTTDDENNGKMYSASSTNLISPIVKICDLGNACWIDKHFTDDITTRQYRAPESILQCGYNTKVDIWSHACMIFELITGDYLFDPREKESTKDDSGYSRDEDHLALIGELCGKFDSNKNIEYSPWPIKWTHCNDKRFNQRPNDNFDNYLQKLRANIKRPGLVSSFFGGYKILKRDEKDIKWDFTKKGDQLSNIQKLDYWSLAAVLEEKYKIPNQKKSKKDISYKNAKSGHEEAINGSLAHFLGRMLEIDPDKRATAKEMLQHKWLIITKQDIEECYKAECKWFKSNGKPTTDTNANYGLSSRKNHNQNQSSSEDDDDDLDESQSNDESSDDDDDDEQTKTELEDDSDYDDRAHRSRSRESSVDGRDQFANSRAESEPPPTWHKYLGIKWYQQFEEYALPTHNRDTTEFDEEWNSKFEGLNINGIEDDHEMNDENDVKRNGNGKFNGYHNGHNEDEYEDADDEDEDEDDLYAMDPDFDPHAGDEDNDEEQDENREDRFDNYDDNDVFEDGEEDDDDDESTSDGDFSDEEREDKNKTKTKRKVTLEISDQDDGGDDDREQNGNNNNNNKTNKNNDYISNDYLNDYGEYAKEFEQFRMNGNGNGLTKNMKETNNNDTNGHINIGHETQSSIIIHGDGGGFTLEELGIIEHIDDDKQVTKEDEDQDDDDEEEKDDGQVYDSSLRRKNSSDDKMKYITNPDVQPFFNEFNQNKKQNGNHIGIGVDKHLISNLIKLDEQQMTPLSNNSKSGNQLSYIHDDFEDDDIDVNEIGDALTSLPHFNHNNNNNNPNSRNSQSISISSNGSHGSHSRDISSASTLDID